MDNVRTAQITKRVVEVIKRNVVFPNVLQIDIISHQMLIAKYVQLTRKYLGMLNNVRGQNVHGGKS